MLATLPTSAEEFSAWDWAQIAPYYEELLARPLSAANVAEWLTDWTRLSALIDEVNSRFTIATTANTADEAIEERYRRYLDDISPKAMEAEQSVKEKLLASGLEPEGFAVPLHKLRTAAALYREANLPLLAEERKLSLEYDKISGARAVIWEGKEVPWVQLFVVLEETNRDRREAAWRAMNERVLQDSAELADLWKRMMAVRCQIAANAGYADYRAYRWQQLYRFDYTPEDAKSFHAAIEEVVVPAAQRLYARRRQRLGLSSLRPWDVYVDSSGRAPLRPYTTIEELETKTSAIFHAVDPVFGGYFETMRQEHLLDLESRPNKAAGGYMLAFSVTRRPFIFSNSIGAHEDVQTLLHEGGHSFHAFEVAPLPYLQQRQEQMLPMEFAEVASMGMELLGSPYLTQEYGAFYTPAEAARARIAVLEGIITFWPYMAIIDALQHWMYEHPEEASDLNRCNTQWIELTDRFQPHLDWGGLEAGRAVAWHHQSHPFQDPFYYIEYGMAELGAVQVWANALRDPKSAVANYRRALALGGTATLPELYTAAGARFAFDADMLRMAVTLIEQTLDELEPIAAQG